MKTKHLILLVIICNFIFLSCEQDNDPVIVDEVNLTISKPDNIVPLLDAAAMHEEYVEKRA